LARNQEAIEQFAWDIASIRVYLEEIRQVWASALGISHAQWMILMALSKLDKDDGVAVNIVAKLLHVESSFVTTQSKKLEKKGLLRRKRSSNDARIVAMSLSDKTYKHLSSLTLQQAALDEFIFMDFNDEELFNFVAKLTALKNRIGKARLRATLDY
jgi:DNA-binding MarR family transcriptional regulator